MSTRYNPVNQCIYCGSANEPLSKEHIVPFGLAGDRILPKASCEDCRKETGKIENYCLREIMGKTRIVLGIQTRNPQQRPTELPIILKLPDGAETEILVAASEFPLVLALPLLPPAKEVRDYPVAGSGPYISGAWHFHPPETEMTEFLAKHGGNSVVIGQFEPLIFCRMLAKIAHGLAVAEYGLGAFTPTTTDLIRGLANDFDRWVGGSIGHFDKPENKLHQLDSYTHKETGDIVVTIRLFANLSAPIYHVLVGRRITRSG